MQPSVERMAELNRKMTDLLENFRPGLNWAQEYGLLLQEFTELLLTERLPESFIKALLADWTIVEIGSDCGCKYSWMKPMGGGTRMHTKGMCICHSKPV